MRDHSKTGLASINKFHYPTDVACFWLGKQREWNKKMLKDQLDSFSLVVVPNACKRHIDLEMTVLRNVAIDYHSDSKSIR